MYKISFFPFIVFEILASVFFVLSFGFGNFLIFLLVSMFSGVVLLALFWKNMLEFQILEPRAMLSQFAYVIVAFLFIIPGVLSSFLGILLFIFAFIFGIKKRIRVKEKNTYKTKPKYNEEIIDVEIIEDKK